ncbi:MAG: hydantoinase/oxoprolinase family protein [Ardenticatenaceae bacterium]|nr:hydantoinase/oxoprolinase family protein [Ardenticatenaceae bacterium]
MALEVAIDIGGTFTDVVLLHGEQRRLVSTKVLSTPADPSISALQGLEKVLDAGACRGEDINVVVHATTLVSNALLEARGAKTAVVTTRGFRDVLEIAREHRFDLYDLFLEHPRPLVPRHRRLEISERIDNRGQIVSPLKLEEIEQISQYFLQTGVESIAICLLHSYVNNSHEQMVAQVLRELIPGCFVTISSDISSEIGEYERFSTTVANSYVGPLIRKYLDKLAGKLNALRFSGDLYLMQSGGGLLDVPSIQRQPIRLAESGPAAGVLGAGFWANTKGLARALSFDMGGTTAKISFLDDGQPRQTDQFEVARSYQYKRGSGYPIKLPTVDLIEIGAGGGSIAWLDRAGLLRVGPESAGAEPGPACYGQGGTRPTVTDADVALGIIDPDCFAGGSIELYPENAFAAIEEHIARSMGVSVVEAAWGIKRVVDESMATAAQVYLSELGQDPRTTALIAYGGAGPVHACALARRLGVSKILIPPLASVGASVGLLTAPLSLEVSQSFISRLSDLDSSQLKAALSELERRTWNVIANINPASSTFVKKRAYLRYQGQFHDLSIELEEGDQALEPESLRNAFEACYKRTYGLVHTGYDIKLQRLSVTAYNHWHSHEEILSLIEEHTLRRDVLGDPHRDGHRLVYYGPEAGWVNVKTHNRAILSPGFTARGPLIIDDDASTIFIEDGDAVEVDKNSCIVVARSS